MMRANEIKSRKIQEKEKLNDEVCLLKASAGNPSGFESH